MKIGGGFVSGVYVCVVWSFEVCAVVVLSVALTSGCVFSLLSILFVASVGAGGLSSFASSGVGLLSPTGCGSTLLLLLVSSPG